MSGSKNKEKILWKDSYRAMSQKEQIQLFEEKKVRTVWDDEKEELKNILRSSIKIRYIAA